VAGGEVRRALVGKGKSHKPGSPPSPDSARARGLFRSSPGMHAARQSTLSATPAVGRAPKVHPVARLRPHGVLDERALAPCPAPGVASQAGTRCRRMQLQIRLLTILSSFFSSLQTARFPFERK
jgi:hypothetical protein